MLTLLDTTLRDGSYVVDFQFTAVDTALIAGALDACNVPLIEVGHGVGLRGGSLAGSRAACSDREYAEAAAKAVVRGKWGMFCIPGIAELEDVDMLADMGAGFVRVGTNVTSVHEAAPFIARAKARGLWVSANFMKTYALPPAGVAAAAAHAAEFGADLVCIVDSAGGMLPDDVAAYADAMLAEIGVPVGFHGHDNLGLAVANTLRAVQAGVSVIDTSLRGMGRSAGNACTEMVLYALRRQGIELGVDPLAMLTIAEQRIDPMLRSHQSRDSIGIVSGFAQFHSSFLDRIYAAAELHGVDARALIVSVTGDDKVNAPVELVRAHAERLANEGSAQPFVLSTLPASRAPISGDLAIDAQHVAREAHALARRHGKRTVFTLTQSWREPDRSIVFQSVHEGPQFVMASAEVATPAHAKQIATAIESYVDTLLVDVDQKTVDSSALLPVVMSSVSDRVSVLTYSDLDAWARSVVQLVSAELAAAPQQSVRLYAGDARSAALGEHVTQRLRLRGVVVQHSAEASASVLVCCAPLSDTLADEWMHGVSRVIDGWLGALPLAALERAHASAIPVQRVDMRAVMQAEVLVAQESDRVLRFGRGSGELEGILVAAGGVIAPRGTVILDSLTAPSRVFGIADGRGLLLDASVLNDAEHRAVQTIERRVALVGV